jgi:hypothetical protein
MNINIGGGAGWSYAGWRNFDQREGFRFTPKTVLPVEDASAEIVYSSHCFEHLDDATVAKLLSEARRICKGALVLKLPDFDQVIERWRAGDSEYFNHWGMGKVVKTWKNLGIEDTIDARASMIFCGWWNDAYGDEWGSRNPDTPGAYHGPCSAHMSVDYTPHNLAKIMRQCAPLFASTHFNHQNAWSRGELGDLLERHGFTVEHMDAEKACLLPIPTITDMRGISMYAVAH